MFRYYIAKIKRLLVKFLSAFMPTSQMRKDFRHKFFLDIYEMPTIKSNYYGKIYMPYYPNFQMPSTLPDLYNKEGRKIELFFLRNRVAGTVYSKSKYFEWDRYNIGLDVHFYKHGAILETMGFPKERYGLFSESESIIPHEYAIFKKHKGIEKDFNAIFTYSEELLETLDNAKFFPLCSYIWYGQEIYKGVKDNTELSPEIYTTKNKNISMVCSSKRDTEMQKIRHYIAGEALKTGKVDIFGGFMNGKRFDYKSRTLKDYRYQIVVENDIKPYYFTEKIMDCFASMTVPIYIGATKIDKFFNPDGIIKISEKTDLESVLKNCNEQDYQTRIDALKENYDRCLRYLCLNDLLYETYFMDRDKEGKEQVDLYKVLQRN